MKDLNTDIVNEQLFKLYNDKFSELDNKGNCSTAFPIFIKCPQHYCDVDNKRIMFIRTVPTRVKPSNILSSVSDGLDIYERAVLSDFRNIYLYEERPEFEKANNRLRNYLNSVNSKLNKGKQQNYIFTYIFKNSLFYIEEDKGELIRTSLYEINVEILKEEISILKPDYIFFLDLDFICTFSKFGDNHSAKFDFLKSYLMQIMYI